MTKHLAPLFFLVAAMSFSAPAEVLIVADEIPAMEVIAKKLKDEERIKSTVVWQTNLPSSLKPFEAVVVYIHGALSGKAEDAFIDYTKNGGKLIAIHHSISSGKAKNPHWFSFLGVSLPETNVNSGGYKWIEPATWNIVNLAPNHFITTNKVSWPEQIDYKSATVPAQKKLPAFTLEDDEVYLNHILDGSQKLLMGFKYTGAKQAKPRSDGRGITPPESLGVTYMQDTAGWLKPAGKGWIIYLMPGHFVRDFENPAYARIVLNAIIYKSERR